MWMAEGRRRSQWEHTSNLLAAIENTVKRKGQVATTAAERNPYLRQAAKRDRPKIRSIKKLARMWGVKES
jgi:hypothetical protein